MAVTHQQAAVPRTGWTGGALKLGTRTVQRPLLWRNGREVPSPGSRGNDTSNNGSNRGSRQKIIRLGVVWRISSAPHKPALIREVL
jgi:hypothetical protein